MYTHPANNEIDSAMLSKILHDLNYHLNTQVGICAIGGTALMLLDLKKGSLDIDIIPLTHSAEIKKAIEYTISNVKEGKIYIPITENRKEVKKFFVSRNLVIQTFARKLPLEKYGTFLNLPNDFQQFMHEIKTIRWILPEGGREVRMSTRKLLDNIQLYSLGIYDIICTKIFMPRQKDVEDIQSLLNTIPISMRFLGSRKKQLMERFLQYVYANQSNKRVVITGINFYNNLVRKSKTKLLPLPDKILNDYKEYLQ